jgi:pyruvate, orthophosphate dikinase
MDGLPVTVRLLDPPLHEFLPDSKDLAKEIALREGRGEDAGELIRQLRVAENLEERNPMLGLRGCRLGLLRPEVYLMQARAIMQAARSVREAGGNPVVEIMIPLVGFASELERMRTLILEEITGEVVPIGTMIELPRACAVAGEIARAADFFSFGTNDLTQMVCGISRDDAEEKFLSDYLKSGILQENPFETLDRDGVGELVHMARERGRETNPHLKLGVCGEHGGDPKSVAFFHEVGLDYVSCSPFRVPGARLAAAQAALKERSTTRQPV